MRTNKIFEQLLKTSTNPGQLLNELYLSGWLKQYLPEVHRLYGIPQRPEHHPEVDVGKHIELCMEQAAKFGANHRVRFAVLMHDLGKGITPVDMLPRHHNHETTGIPLVASVCDRIEATPRMRKLALAVCEFHIQAHSIFTNRSSTINSFVKKLGFEEDNQFLIDFVLACRSDATGRQGKQFTKYPQGDFLIGVTQELRKLPMKTLHPEENKQSHELYMKRLEAIRFMRKVHDTNITRIKTP